MAPDVRAWIPADRGTRSGAHTKVHESLSVICVQTGVVIDVPAKHAVLWICPLAMIALCALDRKSVV